MQNNQNNSNNENVKPKNPKTLKWHQIYYLLAIFNILIVVCSLFLSHHLISLQKESVSKNEVWVNRIDCYLELRSAITKINEPGNDVFSSANSFLERNNLREAIGKYKEKFDEEISELEDDSTEFRTQFKEDLFVIDSDVKLMVARSEKILENYEKGEIALAAAEMSKMDKIFGDINEKLSNLYANVIGIQSRLLSEQSEYNARLQRFELVIAALALLMIIIAILYGRRIKKQTEEAQTQREKNFLLAAANNFSTQLFNSMADLLLVANNDGIIQKVNEATLNILGYKESEILGKPISILTQEKTFLTDEEFAHMAKHGKLVEVEKEFVCRNGERLKVLISSSLIGEVDLTAVVVAKDITKLKENEQKLQNYTDKLAQSNRELEDFAYVASHDLQEPLRKVQAFGDRLNGKFAEIIGDEGRDYISRMQGAASRMQTLINDLLTFSRVTTNAQPFRNIDVNQIAKEVISDLEVRLEETKGRVEIGELPEIDADPMQIRQLMQNLIGNALKFHRNNENPIVKVYSPQDLARNTGSFSLNGEKIQTHGNGEKFCQIIVQDNGIGFDEKYLDRIFTVFQRLHGRTEYAGSGIGLAVCRKIVERHGGSITAESKEGKGSAFLITLPFHQNYKETN